MRVAVFRRAFCFLWRSRSNNLSLRVSALPILYVWHEDTYAAAAFCAFCVLAGTGTWRKETKRTGISLLSPLTASSVSLAAPHLLPPRALFASFAITPLPLFSFVLRTHLSCIHPLAGRSGPGRQNTSLISAEGPSGRTFFGGWKGGRCGARVCHAFTFAARGGSPGSIMANNNKQNRRARGENGGVLRMARAHTVARNRRRKTWGGRRIIKGGKRRNI